MQHRALDGAAARGRVVMASVTAEGIRSADVLCMTTAQTARAMARGAGLLSAPPERSRGCTCIVKWPGVTVTVQLRTTAEAVVLAGKIVIDLSAVAAARNVERIFRRYNQSPTAGAGGMFEGGMIRMTFYALVDPVVIIVMPGMTTGRATGSPAGGRSPVTAVAISRSGECIRSPDRSTAFKMAVDVGTAAENKSAGLVRGLGK